MATVQKYIETRIPRFYTKTRLYWGGSFLVQNFRGFWTKIFLSAII